MIDKVEIWIADKESLVSILNFLNLMALLRLCTSFRIYANYSEMFQIKVAYMERKSVKKPTSGSG